MPSHRLAAIRASLRRDESGVSEVLATVLLTAMTVAVLGGFGALVLASLDEARDAPAAAFALEAREGDAHVLVRFVSGSPFRVEAANVVVLVDAQSVGGAAQLVSPAVPGVYGPGDVLRVDLSSGPLPAGARVAAFVVDIETGRLVGSTLTQLQGAPGVPAYAASEPRVGAIAVDPAVVTVDGRSLANLTVDVSATHGLGLVRAVSVNLTGLGGAPDVPLRDDGVAPDALAGDGVYTLGLAASRHAFSRVPSVEAVSVPVAVTDVFGKTASGQATILLQPAPLGKVGAGAKYRDLPESPAMRWLNLTSLTFRDVAALPNDQVQLRVSDLSGASGAWTALVSFDAPASCGGAPVVSRIVLSRDGVPGSLEYAPAEETCFTLGGLAQVNLAAPAASLDASGATASWVVTGDASVFSYAAAGIGPVNEATVTFFGDALAPGPAALGLGQADLEWARLGGNLPPMAAFSATPSGLSVVADASASSDSEAGALTYAWDWGDGATSSGGPQASHAYAAAGSYTVTLTVADPQGASGATTRVVVANRAPTASFTHAASGLTLSVDASASADPDGQALAYAWDWGNGATSSGGPQASHAYALPGAYTVTLTVTDPLGGSGAASADATVVADNQGPSAALSVNATSGTAPLDVRFSLSGSDPDGTIVSWTLQHGDGTAATGAALPATRDKTYAQAGAYAANLTVTDNLGATHTASVLVTVGANRAPVLSSFTLAGLDQLNATVAALASDPDGDAVSYAFAWGDGTNASLRGATPDAFHAYASAGNRTVTVYANDTRGGSASAALVVQATSVHYALLAVSDAGTPAGAIADVERIQAEDGAGATLTESSGAGVPTVAPAACSRTFDGCASSGWSLVSGSFSAPTVSGAGTGSTLPGGTSGNALALATSGAGPSGLRSGSYRVQWTQAADPAAQAGTFSMGYRFQTMAAGQSVTMALVAPSGAVTSLGTAGVANVQWNAFSAPIPAAILQQGGTFTLFANVTLDKNTQLLLDDVGASWSGASAFRLQKQLSVVGLPGGSLSHHLEVRAAQGANPETLLLLVEGPAGTWTTRGSVGGTDPATLVHRLAPEEIQSGVVSLRLVDADAGPDALQSAWLLDSVRVVVRG